MSDIQDAYNRGLSNGLKLSAANGSGLVCKACAKRNAKPDPSEFSDADWRQLRLEISRPFTRSKAYGVRKA